MLWTIFILELKATCITYASFATLLLDILTIGHEMAIIFVTLYAEKYQKSA